ncbi:uncharacterized protein LACBIDRAFT_327596 [Laccaria bicolor S238N-H82]|uniref:Predicted protein n=1 Tax=Laccaria bicolor (strain S238N-H82 / ATCC MYA-4686) TaxID=486041 RepID=B0DC78_LACBS|nr:uncharacterized protein LACBIDRAFT_327596 [Laccaria bicolor S238N-H82]EDR07849.1 predicted protein [Laccaria bicolor S238N-H82]|eukprot:XP_001881638.1 predicted protein [Laccaria bicolor S238N-H82]
MVKRAKSPDATDDVRYMTVYQPYPMNANWELPSDVIAFAFWIAGCIGVEPLLGLHYKPKASRRAAQKDGWKRIHVESHWFKDWSPNNGVIHKPYPTTHWCPVPPEDKTNKPLCRRGGIYKARMATTHNPTRKHTSTYPSYPPPHHRPFRPPPLPQLTLTARTPSTHENAHPLHTSAHSSASSLQNYSTRRHPGMTVWEAVVTGFGGVFFPLRGSERHLAHEPVRDENTIRSARAAYRPPHACFGIPAPVGASRRGGVREGQAVVVITHWDEEVPWGGEGVRPFRIWEGVGGVVAG